MTVDDLKHHYGVKNDYEVAINSPDRDVQEPPGTNTFLNLFNH